MVLLVVSIAVLCIAVVGVGGWLLLPTLRAARHPDFEPTYTDDEAVLRAQQSYIDTAGGGGVGL